MADDIDIAIWMNKHRLDALRRYHVDVEKELYDHLDSLYESCVPFREKGEIEAQIKTEQAEHDRYYEQNRRFALLEIVENGVSCYCESDNCTTLFSVASRFVKALKMKKTQGKHFKGGLTDLAFGDFSETDPSYMRDYTMSHSNDPRVVFCATINLDQGYINDWNVGYCGWTQYDSQRLTDGVRAATRKQHLTLKQREEIFEAKINEGNPELCEDEDVDAGMQMQ